MTLNRPARSVVPSIAAVLVTAVLLNAQQSSRLRGVWQLVEVIPAGATTGTVPQPGQYMFTDSHYSFTRVTAAKPRALVDRPDFVQMTPEQFRELTEFVGEAGTYEIDRSILTIHRTVAFLPVNMVPNNSATFVVEVQDDTMTLTPRTRADGAPLRNNAILKFRRLE